MQLLCEKSDNYDTREKTGRLNPLNDFVFKQYMGTEECKVCLLSFLNAVLYGTTLEEKITQVEIMKNLELSKKTPEGKLILRFSCLGMAIWCCGVSITMEGCLYRASTAEMSMTA